MTSLTTAPPPLQVMGDELVQILESQRQLEQQLEWQMDGRGGGMGDRRDYARSMASAAQGNPTGTNLSKFLELQDSYMISDFRTHLGEILPGLFANPLRNSTES